MNEQAADQMKASAQAVWGASPAGTTLGGGAEPGTIEFFDLARMRRAAGEMAWLPQVFPFERTRGSRVLEIGCGAGFDAYTFASSGAEYSAVDLTAENVDRTKAHLGFYGYTPEVRQADAEQLPFADSSFDVVFSNGVLHHTPDMAGAFAEAQRVLRPGGEFWVAVYHRNSAFYWLSLVLVEHLLLGGFRKRTLADELSRIEFTTSDAKPLVNVYSRGELRRLLRAAGLEPVQVCVRKLQPEDLPAVLGLSRLWRRIPQGTLDRVGRIAGWYVTARARKAPEVS